MTLKRKAVTAVGWTVVEQISTQALNFILSIILARLLLPSDFGTVALLGIFLGIANSFIDGGFSSAIIQKRDVTQDDLSTVFWFNLAAAFALAIALFLAAPWISAFFDTPSLTIIARCFSLVMLINSTTSVHQSLFAKHLDMRTPLQISLIGIVIGGGMGVYLAYKGFGPGAIVGQALTGAFCSMSCTWFWSKWRPSLRFSPESFRGLFRFGGFLFIANILNIFYQQLSSLIIGKRYGPHSLGLYNRGDTTSTMISIMISNLGNRITFPLLSQVNDNPERLRKVSGTIVRGMMLLNIPAMLGVAVVAKPMVLSFYGEAWLPAAEFLAVLALAKLLLPLHHLNLDILKATGHSNRFLKLELIKRFVGLLLIIAGAFFGIRGLAWAMVISSMIAYVINTRYSHRLIGYGLMAQIRDLLPIISASLIMVAAILIIALYTEPLSPLFQLAIQVLSGGVIYGIGILFFRVPEVQLIVDFLKKFLPRASS